MKHRVLFVCTGNICRSPMAEGLFQAALDGDGEHTGWQVDSAGTHAGKGICPAPAAVAVAAAYGADISALRSRPLEQADFVRFDTIVALDRGHLDMISFMRPEAFSGTITLMPSTARSGFIEVPDPYGDSRRGYEAAGRLIVDGVAALLTELRS